VRKRLRLVRSRGIGTIVVCAAAATLLLAESGSPAQLQGITVKVDAPATIRIGELFNYRITVTYQSGPEGEELRVTDALPPQIAWRGWATHGCGGDPVVPALGERGGAFACTTRLFTGFAETTIDLTVRATEAGDVTNTVRLSNGEAATVTSTVRPPDPPPSPPPPPPSSTLPGPPAAPTRTIVETFSTPGAAETETVPLAAAARTAQVALSWPDSAGSFDATGFRIVDGGRVRALSAAELAALRITKKRTAKTLDVRIASLRPGPRGGKLRFRVVANRLKGRTRVTVKVRQSKRA